MSAVELVCPRCGAQVDVEVLVRPRFIAEDGASYLTATTRAGRTAHTCKARR